MNISLIHVFEIVVILLVVGTLLQIRRLYLQSERDFQARTKAKTKASTRNRIHKPKPIISSPKQTKMDNPVLRFKQPSTHFPVNNLPLPEVSFSSNKKVQREKERAANVTRSTQKSILNSYIDDFFFEETPRFPEVDRRQSIATNTNSHVDDEFITVAEENAEMVRAFQYSNQKLMLVR